MTFVVNINKKASNTMGCQLKTDSEFIYYFDGKHLTLIEYK